MITEKDVAWKMLALTSGTDMRLDLEGRVVP